MFSFILKICNIQKLTTNTKQIGIRFILRNFMLNGISKKSYMEYTYM